jgi:hypothetical protein
MNADLCRVSTTGAPWRISAVGKLPSSLFAPPTLGVYGRTSSVLTKSHFDSRGEALALRTSEVH